MSNDKFKHEAIEQVSHAMITTTSLILADEPSTVFRNMSEERQKIYLASILWMCGYILNKREVNLDDVLTTLEQKFPSGEISDNVKQALISIIELYEERNS